MPGTYSRFGSAIVFGEAMPRCVASAAPNSLSSADHMNGLFTTVTPATTACFSALR